MVTIGAMVVTSTKISDSYFSLDVGSILVIGASFFWAIDNNVSKIITKRVDILKIAQLKSAIGGAILLGGRVCYQYPSCCLKMRFHLYYCLALWDLLYHCSSS